MDNYENVLPAFYGSVINKSKACGYCWKHHLYLTVNTLKRRECLGKQCNALKKEEHDYWRQREQRKMMKKERRSACGQ